MADAYFSLLSLILVLPLTLLIFLYFIVRPRPVRVPIKNRHVFITGGSSGIGLALAHQCAQQGADVTLLARNVSKLEEAKEAIKLATGRDVRIFSADVREYENIVKVVEEVGEIDVLVCNHGVYVPQELESQELEEIRFMIDVNLMGTFHLIKAALPGMKKNRAERGPGSIAIMSSQAGQVGIYGYTAYSASKFGLRGMAEALQQEIIADNIHISLIFPPDTETPGFVEENKRRPQLTSIIAASSGAMKADEVAKKSIDGIKSGTFIVPCNFEGFLLSVATAGLCPQRSFLMAFVEVVTSPILRIAGLCFQWNWYGSIEKWYAQKKQCKNTLLQYLVAFDGFTSSDLAFFCEGHVGVGVVTRDHTGSIVAVCSKLVDGRFSPEDAEGLALREDLRLLKTCGLRLAATECDALRGQKIK
ncbi:3-dehydrosphinganine reductase TSC10A [Forsythia ovata]|uniref:3-dehydrosphinganine reductase n=2 Tax=Forsythia ovata TaxID=205694 RepID=A0ABD1P438_9LAMI